MLASVSTYFRVRLNNFIKGLNKHVYIYIQLFQDKWTYVFINSQYSLK